MSDIVLKACSALAAICGLVMVVQGIRAGLSTRQGRDQVNTGLAFVLIIGPNLLPESLQALRDALVVTGCLVLLGLMLWRLRRGPGSDADERSSP